jgi:alcohol dehydrogenase, propanol-preferring
VLDPRVPLRTTIVPYALEDAGAALDDLRHGRIRGAAVLSVAPEDPHELAQGSHG